MLKVLADPARLRLLSLIQAQPNSEACVCHLTAPVGLSSADREPSPQGAPRGGARYPRAARKLGVLPGRSRRACDPPRAPYVMARAPAGVAEQAAEPLERLRNRAVERERPPALALEQAGLCQLLQVIAHRRLRKAEHGNELTDARCVILLKQHVEDPQAMPIGKRPEQLLELFGLSVESTRAARVACSNRSGQLLHRRRVYRIRSILTNFDVSVYGLF